MAVKASAHITIEFIKDIQATYRYYLLQSSTLTAPDKPTTNPPDDSWDDAEPTYTSGSTNSLYYVDLTVFSDDTFSYSAVSLSTAYEAAKEAYNKAQNAQDTADNAQADIDGLEIGGQNLLLNSSFAEDFYKWRLYAYDDAKIVDMDGYSCGHMTGALAITKYVRQTMSLDKISSDPVEQEYTVSIWVKLDDYVAGTTNALVAFYLAGYYDNDGTSTYFNVSITSGVRELHQHNALGWVKHTYTFTIPIERSLVTSLYVYVYARDFTGDLYFRNAKLEKSNRATDWSPAPEDVDITEIGGRNLLIDSENLVFIDYSGTTSTTEEDVEVSEWDALHARRIYGTSGTGTIAALIDPYLYFLTNQDYVGSIYIKNNHESTSMLFCRTTGRYGSSMWVEPGESKRISFRYNPDDLTGIRMQIHAVCTTATEFDFTYWRPKWEKGTRATDWTPAPEDIDQAIADTSTEIKTIISEQTTSTVATCESIIMTALESYVETGDYESFKETVSAELSIMAEQITLGFTNTSTQIETIDGTLQETTSNLSKYFEFGTDGLIIKSGESTVTLKIDNDKISFMKNGVTFGWWDGDDFHTGNIVVEVNERAQFGDFAFLPRSDGSLMFVKLQEQVI